MLSRFIKIKGSYPKSDNPNPNENSTQKGYSNPSFKGKTRIFGRLGYFVVGIGCHVIK